MKVSGIERIEMGAEELFGRLSDLERLGDSLPSVQAVDVEHADRFTAAFRPTTGLGSTPVEMGFEVVERRPPQRLRVRGNGGGGEYAVDLQAAFDLVGGDGATEVHWSAEVRLHGVLRSLTQRVLPDLVAHQVSELLREATGGAAGHEAAGRRVAEDGATHGHGTEGDTADPRPGELVGDQAGGTDAPAGADAPLHADHVADVGGAGADAGTIADPDTYRKGPGW